MVKKITIQKHKIPEHLLKLAGKHREIFRQFFFSNREVYNKPDVFDDPFDEDKNTPVKGLVHVYTNRVLFLLTARCAAFCRFCMRRRKTLDPDEKDDMDEKDLISAVSYIKKHPRINEVIFSGGDPFVIPGLLKKALIKISKLKQIKVIRISTRIPIIDPQKINSSIIQALNCIKNKPLYICLHVNHPAELTVKTERAVKKLQKVSTMVLSQSVLLKNINDSVEVLEELFNKLLFLGIKPYYLFQCDPVRGTGHFAVDFKKGVRLYTGLRKRLSGLACPLYTIESLKSRGKVLIPAGFWDFNFTSYKDFRGRKIKITRSY